MVVKRLTLLFLALLCVVSVDAQQSKSDASVEFRPHWDIQLQGGVAYTLGETSTFGDLISPSIVVSTNYRFHHAMGVRFGLGGWQGKGVLVSPKSEYAFNFLQLNADYKLGLCSLIGGYNHRRVVDVYLLAGVGLNYGFNNKEANALAAERQGGEVLGLLWDSKLFVAGRFGLGLDFRVGKNLMLNLEANANVLPDRFNSKRAENVDWQMNLLAGVSYSFGGKTRTSQKWLDEQEAIKAAERAAEEAEHIRVEEEKQAAEEAERIKDEEAKQAAEEAERIKIEEERQANVEEHSEDIFFLIGSAVIRESEADKLVSLSQWLTDNDDYRVSVVGYADKETGTTEGNLRLSERRAEAVRDVLVKAGVDISRIDFAFMGDSEQPFESAEENRVVICTLE